MTAAIIWLVVWVILAGAGMWLSVVLFTLCGVGIAAALDKVWPAPALMVLGYIVGIAWLIFAAVNVIQQGIDVFQLATA